MNRRIVIVTAVPAPSAGYLPEAYRSLCEQRLPHGWEWHWVIQEDGRTEAVAPYVPDDVRVPDADDLPPPGALARDLTALEADPALGWATSRVLDLFPDGSTTGFPGDPDHGPIEHGAVLHHWRTNDFRAPVHPATLCVRRELLLSLGGWMALPASEDTGLLLALNSVSRGWFSQEVGLLHRKWDGQVTGQPPHVDPVEREARMSVMEERARALAALQWRTTPKAPQQRSPLGDVIR